MDKKFILVTGGARSGKSWFSEELGKKLGSSLVYIATMEGRDREMKERIKKHRNSRGGEWKTFEAPLEVLSVLKEQDGSGKTILIDCLTLFVSNLMLKKYSEKKIEGIIRELALSAKKAKAAVVIVTNEVGMGLVPPYKMGRKFRDLQGTANKIAAGAADEVYFMVAGIPLKIK